MAGPPLILASGSPRRRELLERVGMTPEVRPADIDETPAVGENAMVYARRLARDKAASVAAAWPQRWILAADTVVDVGGQILGKAPDAAAAEEMLRALSGADHQVHTAFAVRGPGHDSVDSVTTTVTMRELPDAEIAAYVAAGEWRGKAGAYAIQGMAAAMVTRVVGSVTNVIGLPLAEVVVALRAAGGPRPAYREGTAA